MKWYYCKHGDFSNVYDLAWVDAGDKETREALEAIGYTRVRRREALYMCWAEEYRREHDQAMGGYADNVIYPACIKLITDDDYRWDTEYKATYYNDRSAKYIIEEA